MAQYAMAQLRNGELHGSQLITPETFAMMTMSATSTGWDEWLGPMVGEYALGWWSGAVDGHHVTSGHGADPGFQSASGLLPDDDVAVIAMTNIWDPENDPLPEFEIADSAMKIMLGMEQ